MPCFPCSPLRSKYVGRLLRFFVQDVQWPVQVIQEKTFSSAARLFAEEIDSRKKTRAVTSPIDRSRQGHRRVVFDLDGQLG